MSKSLEEDVFGISTAFTAGNEEEEDISTLIQLSTHGRQESDSENEDSSEVEANDKASDKGPVWVDEDEDDRKVSLQRRKIARKLRKTEEEDVIDSHEYQDRLRSQFQGLHNQVDWVQKAEERLAKRRKTAEDNEDNSESDDEPDPLRSTAALSTMKSHLLPSSTLKHQRLFWNLQEGSKSAVAAVEFHPTNPVLMTAAGKSLRLFHVDGADNEQLRSVALSEMALSSACFCAHGGAVLCAGKRKFLYLYDINKGKVERVTPAFAGRKPITQVARAFSTPDSQYYVLMGGHGYITLLSQRTRQWVANLKINGTAEAVCVNRGSTELLCGGSDGDVYRWDLRTHRCLGKFADEGSLGITSLAWDPNTDRYAVGNKSGVVNVYHAAAANACRNTTATPEKAILNLTTPVTTLAFTHDGQALLTASSTQKDAVKMYHPASKTVFSNFPPPNRQTLGCVTTAAFSQHSGYLALGAGNGKITLFRLGHYPAP